MDFQKIGIAFELPFEGEAEIAAAKQLRADFDGIDTRDIRDYLSRVCEIIEGAGLYASTGGSHIYICRISDREACEGKDVIRIPRWAFIGEESVARSWQSTARKAAHANGIPIVTEMQGNSIIAAEVIVAGVRHEVEGGYVKCDRSLNHRSWNTTEEADRCPKCFPLNQTDIEMNFFQQLAEMAPGQKLSLLIAPEGGDRISVSILPISSGNVIPLNIKGTAQELDEGFLEEIRKPMGALTGLQSNAAEFEAAVTKGLDKAADKKPAGKTPAKADDKKKPDPAPEAKEDAPAAVAQQTEPAAEKPSDVPAAVPPPPPPVKPTPPKPLPPKPAA